MPENTDFSSLKCLFENNTLSIQAPLISDYTSKEPNQIQMQIVNGKN